MENTFEAIFQKWISDELDRREGRNTLTPLNTFCQKRNLSRTTMWRGEKQGRWKLTRIGKKIYVDESQFTK
jgi:hypothetical protein